jgi:hypothetical protein
MQEEKGTNAALIYFPCCAWSLIEDLPKASFCFNTISFFITLRWCLHSMNFCLVSRTESIPKLYSIAQCTKLLFQRVFIFPNQNPDKRVTFVLLQRWNRVWNSECATHNVFSITPCTGLQIRWFLMCWNWNFIELLNISFLHLYASQQALKLKMTAASIGGFGEIDHLSYNSLGMTSLFIIRALSK